MAVYKVFEMGEEAIDQNNLTTEKEQNIEEIFRIPYIIFTIDDK